MSIHLIPIDDSSPHRADCPCAPFLEDNGMLVHNSFDKREQHERNGHIDPSKVWGVYEELDDGELVLVEE